MRLVGYPRWAWVIRYINTFGILRSFGQRHVASIAFRKGCSPIEALGEDLFAMPGQVTQGDNVTPFVFADYSGQEATAMVTAGLGDN